MKSSADGGQNGNSRKFEELPHTFKFPGRVATAAKLSVNRAARVLRLPPLWHGIMIMGAD